LANNIYSGEITALTAGKMTIGGTDGDVIVDDAAGESVTISQWITVRSTVAAISSASVGFASAAEIQAGTVATKAIAPDQLVASAVPQTLTDAANVSWDMAAGYNAKVTLGGNRTIDTPTNPKEGMTYTLQVIQDGSGTRVPTLPSSTTFNFGAAGAPTFSTAAGKVDIITLFCRDASTPKFRAVFSKDA
jgi:hypothetical protein